MYPLKIGRVHGIDEEELFFAKGWPSSHSSTRVSASEGVLVGAWVAFWVESRWRSF